jgi:hypothetical protein
MKRCLERDFYFAAGSWSSSIRSDSERAPASACEPLYIHMHV